MSQPPTRLQKFLLRFIPAAHRDATIADSLRWRFDCDCGHTFSIWEIGGIKYKATGESLNRVKCPACGVIKMRKLRYHQDG